jgi:hypothetical protein
MDLRTKSIDDSIVVIEEVGNGEIIALDYQPGNGTRYCLVVTKMTRLGPELLSSFGRSGPTWLVSWMSGSEGKAMTCGGGFLHFNYVREKLRCSESDAIVIAEIVGRLTGQKYVSCDEMHARV